MISQINGGVLDLIGTERIWIGITKKINGKVIPMFAPVKAVA